MDQKQSILPSVSVVVPTWNAASFVERVLSALVKQRGVELEILIVDNGVVNEDTKRVTEQFSRQYPFVKYFGFPEQLGYAGAVNAGVRLARNPLVAVSNNDNLPAEDWLLELVRVYELGVWQGKPIGVVSSSVPRPGEYSQHRTHYNFCGRVIFAESEKIPSGDISVFHADGSAFLFNRDIFGLPYKEEYFIYHEDSALGWRARIMGYEVISARRSRAETFDGGTTRRIPYHTAYYSERNRWLNSLCFPSLGTILRLAPVWGLDVVLSFCFGQRRGARLAAWWWIFTHPGFVLSYRGELQAARKVSDREVLAEMTSQYLEVHGSGAGAQAKRILNGLIRLYFSVVCLLFRD